MSLTLLKWRVLKRKGTNMLSNVKCYDCDTLPSQVPVRKMKHENTAEINSFLFDSSN